MAHTQQELADHLDLSDRRVRDLVNLGILKRPKGREGWNFDHNRVAYINYLRELGKQSGSAKSLDDELENETPEVNLERALYVREQCRGKRIQNERELGKLLPIDVVIAIYGDIVASARSKVLAVEGQIVVSLPHLNKSDVATVRQHLHKALNDLKDAETPPPRLIAYLEESASNLGTPSGSDDSRVG